MKDRDWAERLNVSRTPVREAMRKMQQEGVLKPLAAGGYEVRLISRKELVDLYRCRAALEALAAEDAAQHFGPEQQEHLAKILARGDEAISKGNADGLYLANHEFHQYIVELSNNIQVKELLSKLRKMIESYRAALLNEAKSDACKKDEYLRRLKERQEQHREVLHALSRQDGEGAALAIGKHIRETAEEIRKMADDQLPEIEVTNEA